MPSPDQLASGVTELGRLDPFDAYLGGGWSDAATAADATAIAQWQVCAFNAAGKLVPYTGGGDFATGTLTFTANPVAADTVTINGVAITFRASGAVGNEVNIVAGDFVATAQALKALINANPAFGVGASGAAGVLTLMAISAGAAGNAVTLAKSSTQPAISGAVLAGGGTTEGVPAGDAVAIAGQAVPAATPGQSVPVFLGGRFRHNSLIWPAGMETLDQRRAAFSGTGIFVVAQP